MTPEWRLNVSREFSALYGPTRGARLADQCESSLLWYESDMREACLSPADLLLDNVPGLTMPGAHIVRNAYKALPHVAACFAREAAASRFAPESEIAALRKAELESFNAFHQYTEGK